MQRRAGNATGHTGEKAANGEEGAGRVQALAPRGLEMKDVFPTKVENDTKRILPWFATEGAQPQAASGGEGRQRSLNTAQCHRDRAKHTVPNADANNWHVVCDLFNVKPSITLHFLKFYSISVT